MGRILVVDDEVEVCNVLKEFLVSKGYEVCTALDGKAAVSKVKEFRPHIVLLDIIMSGMGGIDTLKEIKKVDPAIGVIMITAVADEQLAKRSLELGAYEYIIKPFDLGYLETAVMVKLLDFS
ncbi:MAG: response regulator [Candidatus Latescibacteria bacterium]|nr:response regulator [Candidatus Latescibacterota bacterium]